MDVIWSWCWCPFALAFRKIFLGMILGMRRTRSIPGMSWQQQISGALDSKQRNVSLPLTQPLSTHSGDAVRRPEAIQWVCHPQPAWIVPGAQPECPSRVRNGFYRNDNIENKKLKYDSGGFPSARWRDQGSLFVLSRSFSRRKEFARDFGVQLSPQFWKRCSQSIKPDPQFPIMPPPPMPCLMA